jgi:hypothetical protein
MIKINEKTFTDGFLESCSDLDLAVLAHDLRKIPEDKPYLNQVLNELSRRAKNQKQT